MDASKIFMGHLLLYGLANNGLGSTIEEVFGKAVTDAGWTDDQRLYATQGIIAGMINSVHKWATDGQELQLAVGKRLSTFDWYTEMAKSIFSGDKSFIEVALGASYGTLDRFGAIGETLALWKHDPNLSSQDILRGLGNTAIQQVSSLRNIEKAYIAYNSRYRTLSKDGDRNVRVNFSELVAQALGMPPAEQADLNKLYSTKKHHFDVLKNLAKTIGTLQVDAAIALNKGDMERYKDTLATIRAITADMPIGDFQYVQRELKDSVYPYDTKLEKELGKYWNKKVHDLGEPLITNREVRDDKITTGQLTGKEIRGEK